MDSNFEIKIKKLSRWLLIVSVLLVLALAYVSARVIRQYRPKPTTQTLPALTLDQPNPLSSDELVRLMTENYKDKISFVFYEVEKVNTREFYKGQTRCYGTGSLYIGQIHGVKTTREKGVWIEVVKCNKSGTPDQTIYPIAKIFMPYEAMYRVTTFQDFLVAVRNYGIVYEIDQAGLAYTFWKDIEIFPPNQILPAHPYMGK